MSIPWRRVLLAAARLAAFYAAGFVVLALLVVAFLDVTIILRDLPELMVPVGVLFGVSFVILAVARRAGFTALWLILVGLWAWMLAQGIDTLARSFVPMRFIGWTVVALPLYALGALGVPGSTRIKVVVLGIWMALVAVGFYYSGFIVDQGSLPTARRILSAAAPFVWGSAPFLIGGYELVRLWLALGSMRRAAAAV